MTRIQLATALLSLATFATAQQEIVRYTFDSTDTNQVLNYARGSQAAPEFGHVTGSMFGTYLPGRFGSSLAHSAFVGMSGNRVETGWQGGHQGAVTIAFFLKNALANSVSQYSPVAGQPSWSVATGGSAGAGLQLTGWGGPDLNGNFATALCSMPGWNHFAVVVDPAAGLGTWYHNGAVATTTPITTGMAATTGELLVGTDWVTICGSLYDIDEFVMLGRAATAAEIGTMAQTAPALTTVFGVNSSLQLATAQTPTLGNAGFTIDVTAQGSGLFVLAGGFSYATTGAVTLPFHLGGVLPGANGQMLLVAPAATTAGVLQSGAVSVALPIPNQLPLLGAQLFLQAIGFAETAVTASNALALRVGE
jgi:hypothetical protein